MTTALIILAILILLFGLFLLLIKPNKRDMSAFLSFDYAHRGLHDQREHIPENSIPAFKRAVENGYGMELDVHLTSDDQLVVFHDDDLKRATNVDLKIHSSTYQEISKHAIFETQETIPLFSQVLNVIDGKTPMIVELKTTPNYKQLCEKVAQMLDLYKGLYCIESFDPRIVLWFKKNRPEVIRGQLSIDHIKVKTDQSFIKNFILTHMLFNHKAKPDFIAYAHDHTHNLSFRLCKKLYKANTVAWTITNIQDAQKAKKYFDTIIFEDFIPHDL